MDHTPQNRKPAIGFNFQLDPAARMGMICQLFGPEKGVK
jgi:hypothetical protein